MTTLENSNKDRVMDDYYVELRMCDLLPAEEEKELFRRYRSCRKCRHKFKARDAEQSCPNCGAPRDFAARDRLLRGALRFVVKVAKDYARRTKGIHYAPDYLSALISAGNLGLLVAVDRFNTEMNTRFLTYATWWIKEKILEELDNTGIVRVPAYRQKQLRLRRKLGESPVGDEANVQMEDLALTDAQKFDETMEINIVNVYGAEVIHNALEQLQLRFRDRYVVLGYFGAREDPKNLRQISARLMLSSERVRQIKKDALERLKDYLEAHAVHDADDVFFETT